MVICGIDPGLKGGLCLLVDGQISPCAMPTVGSELDLNFIKEFLTQTKVEKVFLEQSQAMPGQGVVSMFNYGKSFGQLLGLCYGLGLPVELIKPRVWQAQMFKGTNTKDKPKERALQAARMIFPSENFLATPKSQKPHDGMVDAALIVTYAERFIAARDSPKADLHLVQHRDV